MKRVRTQNGTENRKIIIEITLRLSLDEVELYQGLKLSIKEGIKKRNFQKNTFFSVNLISFLCELRKNNCKTKINFIKLNLYGFFRGFPRQIIQIYSFDTKDNKDNNKNENFFKI